MRHVPAPIPTQLSPTSTRRTRPYTYASTPEPAQDAFPPPFDSPPHTPTSSHHRIRSLTSIEVGQASPRRLPLKASTRARRSFRWIVVLGLLAALLLSSRTDRATTMAVNVKQWTSSSSLATSSEECGMCASSERICSKYGVEALQLTRSYQGASTLSVSLYRN